MVRPELAVSGNKLHMNILGAEHNVTVIEESLYDPKNERIRA
jgi:glycine cleavage system aminomethyltransferase T